VGLGPKGPFLSVLPGTGWRAALKRHKGKQMFHLTQDQLLVIVRALSFYLIDQIKEGDVDNAAKTANMIFEASHSLKGQK
jgi:hypothetical protein